MIGLNGLPQTTSFEKSIGNDFCKLVTQIIMVLKIFSRSRGSCEISISFSINKWHRQGPAPQAKETKLETRWSAPFLIFVGRRFESRKVKINRCFWFDFFVFLFIWDIFKSQPGNENRVKKLRNKWTKAKQSKSTNEKVFAWVEQSQAVLNEQGGESKNTHLGSQLKGLSLKIAKVS